MGASHGKSITSAAGDLIDNQGEYISVGNELREQQPDHLAGNGSREHLRGQRAYAAGYAVTRPERKLQCFLCTASNRQCQWLSHDYD